MKLIRSNQFKNELQKILSFIAKDKKTAAKKFNHELQNILDTLTDHPYKGRPTENGNRELIHKGYTIPYLIDGEDIVILGIFNQNEWSVEEE